MAMKSAVGRRGLARTGVLALRKAVPRVWTEPREDTEAQVILGSTYDGDTSSGDTVIDLKEMNTGTQGKTVVSFVCW